MADAVEGLSQAWEAGHAIVVKAMREHSYTSTLRQLHAAREAFLDALGDMPNETLASLPWLKRAKRDPRELHLWTAGLINDVSDVCKDDGSLHTKKGKWTKADFDKVCLPCGAWRLRSTALLHAGREDEDLAAKAVFTRDHRPQWRSTEWKRWIFDPIEQYAAQWRAIFKMLNEATADREPYIGPKSPAEWGKLFGCTSKTFVRHVANGKIRAKPRTSKSYWVHEADVPVKNLAR